ncbi:paired immunoglobulin-like type 2 receptor alpha [Carettochelys insculpta]|uniref:paired immunoglobulin-like type 2 receptor alpha n=1 Tax=Carettochelys insculpta TaxID=44489 RepID=UPI003EB813BD
MSRELFPLLLCVAWGLFPATAQEGFYKVEQPESLRAPAGGSVTLPCRLIYPPEIEPLKDIRVYWRRGGFHGRFVYNHTERFTHPGYRGRITLVGDPRGKPTRTASIRIDRLQESDTEEYTCQVFVWSRDNDEITWRALQGTRLTVTASAIPSPKPGPQHPEPTTPAAARPSAWRPETVLILVLLASALPKIGICSAVLALCRWRGWVPGEGGQTPLG